MLEELHAKLLAPAHASSPFKQRVKDEATTTWVKPKLVAEVKFTEWTSGGEMRHPAFLGLREDKKPMDVVLEKEEPRVQMTRPLLVIDGDSSCPSLLPRPAEDHPAARQQGRGRHRRFRQLPSSPLRYRATRGRCWSAWDTLGAPTYRHERLRATSRDANSTTNWSTSSTSCRSSSRPAASPRQGGRIRGGRLSRGGRRARGKASAAPPRGDGDRDTYQFASARTTILAANHRPVRWRGSVRKEVRDRYGVESGTSP